MYAWKYYREKGINFLFLSQITFLGYQTDANTNAYHYFFRM